MSVMWTRLPNLSASFDFWVHGFLSHPISASKADGTQQGIRARTTNTFWGENKRHWVLHCYVELLTVGSEGKQPWWEVNTEQTRCLLWRLQHSHEERSTWNRLGAFYDDSTWRVWVILEMLQILRPVRLWAWKLHKTSYSQNIQYKTESHACIIQTHFTQLREVKQNYILHGLDSWFMDFRNLFTELWFSYFHFCPFPLRYNFLPNQSSHCLYIPSVLFISQYWLWCYLSVSSLGLLWPDIHLSTSGNILASVHSKVQIKDQTVLPHLCLLRVYK